LVTWWLSQFAAHRDSFAYPAMTKHIVCLTFDFDAISGFISRGQTTPGWISRGEFGPRVGAPRLLKLLRNYGIASSWYVPGHTIETYPDAVKAVVDAGHEIAHHGWTHRPPASLTREQEEAELIRGNEAIRKISGTYARGYRSPSWDLSPHSVELMLKHGFAYDSSMMGDDYTPYYARQGDVIDLERPARFGQKSALVEMPIHWSTDDSPHFEFVRTEHSVRQGLQNAGNVLDNWLHDFLYMRSAVEWGVLTYTCHPFIIGRGHRIMMLERLIQRMKEGGAVFQRIDETVEEFKQRCQAPV
jgi:peptidoglycan/xylan/chitin deacetylase (PgdA/CDA1 family)